MLLPELGIHFFWAFVLPHSQAEPFMLAHLSSFFGLKFHTFAFVLPLFWLFRACTLVLMVSIQAPSFFSLSRTHKTTHTAHTGVGIKAMKISRCFQSNDFTHEKYHTCYIL
jgi:hypothetical protein